MGVECAAAAADAAAAVAAVLVFRLACELMPRRIDSAHTRTSEEEVSNSVRLNGERSRYTHFV